MRREREIRRKSAVLSFNCTEAPASPARLSRRATFSQSGQSCSSGWPAAGQNRDIEMKIDSDPCRQADFGILTRAWLPLSYAVNRVSTTAWGSRISIPSSWLPQSCGSCASSMAWFIGTRRQETRTEPPVDPCRRWRRSGLDLQIPASWPSRPPSPCRCACNCSLLPTRRGSL